VFVWIVCCYGCVGYLYDCLDVKIQLLQVRTRARADNLAQASQARLSETGRGSPKPSARAAAQAGGPGFERKNASLRRGELA